MANLGGLSHFLLYPVHPSFQFLGAFQRYRAGQGGRVALFMSGVALCLDRHARLFTSG